MRGVKQVPIEKLISGANAKYRVRMTEKKLPDIELKASERLTLSLGKDSKYAPDILETRDLDDIKSWIGIPDKSFDTRPCRRHRFISDWLPAGVVSKSGKAAEKTLKRTVERMKASEHQKIMHLTKAYVYSDSRPVKQYKPLIEAYWDKFKIPIWCFRRIYVPAGSVVTISPGNVGILWAYSIEIEEGGKVLCQGSMTLDVSKIKKI